MRTRLSVLILALGLQACGSATRSIVPNDGTLRGWDVSTKTSHGSGGRWTAQDGVILGTQDKPGNGGLLIADAPYGNVDVRLERKNDTGPTAASSSAAPRTARPTRPSSTSTRTAT
jgi:hypothetical protein